MVYVICLGSVITAIAYFIGFLFIVYILEKAINSFNKFLTIINENIPHINSDNIQIFLLILLGAIIIIISDIDYKQHKNKKDESVYRKDWQKILDIVNVIMIYPIFKFYEKINVIDNTQKVYMLCYAVLFLTVYIFSHYYIYLKNEKSRFDNICSIFYGIFVFIAIIFFYILFLAIYSSIIYLNDFTNNKNIFITILYYAFLIISVIIYSCIYFPRSSEYESIKSIVFGYFKLLIFSIIFGFSSFYNLFVKNSSIYSIHSLILIDIALLVLVSTILIPVKIKQIK
jgi:uncharacterized membrane protein YidH (DUF202 family)